MEVLGKATVLVVIIALGYLVKRLGWLATADFRPLSVIAIRITLPCALIVSFDAFEMRVDMLWLSVFGFTVVSAGMLAAFLIERHRGKASQAFGILNVGSFNIGLFAIPYVGAFVGPEGVIVASMFDVGNALAITGISYGWARALASGARPSPLRYLRSLFATPLFPTYITMVVIGLLGWHLPRPIIAFAGTVGAANTFLAMFMIGVGLQIVLDKAAYADALRFLGIRWGVVAVALIVLWVAIPFNPIEKAVLSAILVAPMAAMIPGLTAEANLPVAASTFMTTVTVLIAVVAMPLALIAAG